MKKNFARKLVLAIVMSAATASFGAGPAKAAKAFNVKGTYVEGCSCSAPCPCEIVGLKMGCQGVGAMVISSGSYGGVDLSGARIALGLAPGKWVRAYIQAKPGPQRQAAEAFARAAFADFGKIESVKDAKVDLTGSAGKYTLKVNGGKIMSLQTEPVLGGNNKTAVEIRNIHDKLNPNMKLATTKSGSFSDGGVSFTLKDTNSYFVDNMKASGKI